MTNSLACHCEERSDEAISVAKPEDCRTALAMTNGEQRAFDIPPLHSLPSIDSQQGQFAMDGKLSFVEQGCESKRPDNKANTIQSCISI